MTDELEGLIDQLRELFDDQQQQIEANRAELKDAQVDAQVAENYADGLEDRLDEVRSKVARIVHECMRELEPLDVPWSAAPTTRERDIEAAIERTGIEL